MTEDSPGSEVRYLIVNADDFGLTDGINRGIIRAHEKGIVTSASLMTRYQSARGAVTCAREHPKLSVGLHFDVAEWRCRSGTWEAVYQVVDRTDRVQLRRELKKQLEEFERLLGRPPTHLDSHQHIHSSEPARSILLEYSTKLQIPLRSCSALIAYRGDFYGQTADGEPFAEGISISRFGSIVEALPAGWTEMGCHPGYTDELDSAYASDREEELRVLCNPETRQLLDLHRIELRSFDDLNRRKNSERSAPLSSPTGGGRE